MWARIPPAVRGQWTATTTSSYPLGTLTVSKATPAISLVSSASPAVFAQPVAFTATIASIAGTPTGTVGFYDGSTSLGTASLSQKVATYTTASLDAGDTFYNRSL